MTGATTRVRHGGTTRGQVMRARVEPAGRLLQETRAQLGLAPRVSLSAGDLSARLRRARYRRVQIQEVRLPVVHDSVASHLAYRQAFGVVRDLLVPDPDDLLSALTARAESYTDGEGRVVFDWQLLVMSARA
jgi:hypothetical protein